MDPSDISRADESWDASAVQFATTLTEWMDIFDKVYWEEAATVKSWDLTEPHTFRYLSIDHTGMLTKVQLRTKALSGSIPDTIGEVVTLEVLDLSENALYGSISESLATCSMLTKLTLFSNQLTGLLTGLWIVD